MTNKQKLEEEIAKLTFNDTLAKKEISNITQFILDKCYLKTQAIPKAEVEKMIIQAEARGTEQAIETFESVPKPKFIKG